MFCCVYMLYSNRKCLCFYACAETIVGVNKHRLAHEEGVEVRSIDNTSVREKQIARLQQVHPSSLTPQPLVLRTRDVIQSFQHVRRRCARHVTRRSVAQRWQPLQRRAREVATFLNSALKLQDVVQLLERLPTLWRRYDVTLLHR